MGGHHSDPRFPGEPEEDAFEEGQGGGRDGGEGTAEEGRPRPAAKVAAVIGVLAAALAGGIAYVVFTDRSPAVLEPTEPAKDGVPQEEGVQPTELGTAEVVPEAASTAAPPSRSPDAQVRALARRLSDSSDVRRWAAAEGVHKRLVAAVWLFSQGRSPRPVLSFLVPEGRFAALDDEADGLRVDPASYARYDGLAKGIASLDAEALGAAYAKLRPGLQAAFREAATRGERFDPVLRSALERLLAVEVPEGPVKLRERGAIYLYEDPALEGLTPAEKHLLRLGPENLKILQTKARAFGRAARLL